VETLGFASGTTTWKMGFNVWIRTAEGKRIDYVSIDNYHSDRLGLLGTEWQLVITFNFHDYKNLHKPSSSDAESAIGEPVLDNLGRPVHLWYVRDDLMGLSSDEVISRIIRARVWMKSVGVDMRRFAPKEEDYPLDSRESQPSESSPFSQLLRASRSSRQNWYYGKDKNGKRAPLLEVYTAMNLVFELIWLIAIEHPGCVFHADD
jgi:hypothetical protein